MGMDYMYLDFDPVAFTVGSFAVRWYALAYLAGFLIGWRYCVYLIRSSAIAKPTAEDIDDFLSWAIVGVILGGRLGYVLFYQLDYYMDNPSEIYQIWKGGMSFHGGVLGVLVSMAIFAKLRGINVFRLSDLVCAAAPIGLFFGRLSNFVNGELYGRQTTLPVGVIFPNSDGIPRHPSQLYEAVLEGLVLFAILYFVHHGTKNRYGFTSGVFLVGYGLFRACIEFVREPDAQIGLIGGYISMGQILCIPMILVGIIACALAYRGKFTAVVQSDDAK